MGASTRNLINEKLTDRLGVKFFFDHPYSAWERGSNEQINGLTRRYLLKGKDCGKINNEQIARIESLINNRPRKCLGFKAPIEIARSFVALQS